MERQKKKKESIGQISLQINLSIKTETKIKLEKSFYNDSAQDH